MPRTRYCVTHDGSFFLWAALPRVGRATLAVITGMSVAQSVRVNHIAKLADGREGRYRFPPF